MKINCRSAVQYTWKYVNTPINYLVPDQRHESNHTFKLQSDKLLGQSFHASVFIVQASKSWIILEKSCFICPCNPSFDIFLDFFLRSVPNLSNFVTQFIAPLKHTLFEVVGHVLWYCCLNKTVDILRTVVSATSRHTYYNNKGGDLK